MVSRGRLNWAGNRSFRLLRVIGRPTPAAAHSTNLPLRTPLLWSQSAPIVGSVTHSNASLLAMVWCAYLKSPFAICSLLLALAASCFFLLTALVEERENLARFGVAYAAYMKSTRRFVPFLY